MTQVIAILQKQRISFLRQSHTNLPGKFDKQLHHRVTIISHELSHCLQWCELLARMAISAPESMDYYLVLDFEATCDDKEQPKPQEIIEFPVLKINAKSLKEESCFHRYVRPTAHPQLTKFCTDLTGITQDMVGGQQPLEEVLLLFDQWIKKEGLLDPNVKFTFVTCGDWDLNRMLPSQCKSFGLSHPPYMQSWMNIKFAFRDLMGVHPKGMPDMLQLLDLPLLGRHHSGIDDTRNIARILTKLAGLAASKGCSLGPTSSYKPKQNRKQKKK